jgi:hypothetical protein
VFTQFLQLEILGHPRTENCALLPGNPLNLIHIRKYSNNFLPTQTEGERAEGVNLMIRELEN